MDGNLTCLNLKFCGLKSTSPWKRAGDEPTPDLNDLKSICSFHMFQILLLPSGYSLDPMNSELLSWATMPYPCLKQMFSFLPDEDRVSANLVCQYWHTVMHSPSLWRTRHFRFCGHCCRYKPVQHVTTVNLIVNFGKYLHRLDVDVYPAHTATGAIRLERAIVALFRTLTSISAQLCYLSIRGVNLNHPSWTETFSHALVEALTDFLEGSCRLNSFHVTDMNNEMNEGLDMLSALAHSKASLACLNTEGYFDHSVAVYTNSLLPGVIHNLKTLTDLTLDYTCVCDNLLIALSETSLKKLSIRCCSTMLHHQVVCGDSWLILSSKCPDLKVTIVIEQIINTVDLTQILKQEIHLTNLTITNAYSNPDEQTWSAKIILQVLLHQYSCCLQHLCLDLKNWHQAIDDQLLALIKSQQILEVLSVSAFLNVSTLEKLLQLRMTNNSSLTTIKFKFYTVRNQEKLNCKLRLFCSSISLPPELHMEATVYSL